MDPTEDLGCGAVSGSLGSLQTFFCSAWLCCTSRVEFGPSLTLDGFRCLWNAKCREGVEDRGADLDFRDLPVEVPRHKTLAHQFHAMPLRFDAASAMISGDLPPQCATEVL